MQSSAEIKKKSASSFRGKVQGQSRQTGFFELALRDRNMQLKFFWKVFLKS